MDTIFKGLVLVALAAGAIQLERLRKEVKQMNLTEEQVARIEKGINDVGTGIRKEIQQVKDALAKGGDAKELLDRVDSAGAGLEALKIELDADDEPEPPTPTA